MSARKKGLDRFEIVCSIKDRLKCGIYNLFQKLDVLLSAKLFVKTRFLCRIFAILVNLPVAEFNFDMLRAKGQTLGETRFAGTIRSLLEKILFQIG